MKFVYLVLFICVYFAKSAHAITTCEEVLKKAYAENWYQKVQAHINSKIHNAGTIINPEKIKWDKVKWIIDNNTLGTEKTAQWLAQYYERLQKGQTTFEEAFAFYAIINPHRGAEIIERLSKATLLGAREKAFFNTASVKSPWEISPRNTFVFPNKVEEEKFNKFFISFVQATQPKNPLVLSHAMRFKFKKAWDKEIAVKKLEARKAIDESRHALKQPVDPQLLASKFGKEYEEAYLRAKEIGLISKDPEAAFAKLAQEKGYENAEKIWLETKHTLLSNGFWNYYFTGLSEVTTTYLIASPFYNYATDESTREQLNNAVIDYYYSIFDEDKLFERQQERQKQEILQEQNKEEQLKKATESWNNDNYDERIKQTEGSESFNPYDPRLLNTTGKANPALYPCDPDGEIYNLIKNYTEADKKNLLVKTQDKMRKYSYVNECNDKLKKQLQESDKLKALEQLKK